MLYFNSYLAVNTRSEPLGGRYLYIKGMQVKGQPPDRKLGTEGLSSNGCLINERERERRESLVGGYTGFQGSGGLYGADELTMQADLSDLHGTDQPSITQGHFP